MPAVASNLDTAVAKIKWRVLPLFLVMFVVNYLDRVNISFIKEQLQTDLTGLNDEAYGLGAGLFFIGYALFEIPSNLILQKIGAPRWLAFIALIWGLLAASMALVHDVSAFYVLRFCLGAAEAGFFPGVIFYLTCWLPASERGKAMAIFLSGSAIGSILSGPLSATLMQCHGFGFKGWQWMVGIEGLFSVLMALVTWYGLTAHFETAPWLSAEEKTALSASLATSTQPSTRPRVGLAVLLDWQILLFCGIYFAIQLTIYAATFWLPTIIRQMGQLSETEVGWLNSLPWLISILGMYGAALAANRWRHPQAWVSAALLIAALGMYLATQGNATFAYIAICFAALGFKSAASLFWPIPQNYLDLRIAAGVIALINSLGNLGGFVAPYTFGWLKTHTGSIQGGLYGLTITSIIAAIVVFGTKTNRTTTPA
jgi:MFS family permease